MENKKQEKIVGALIVIAFAIGICAAILFTIYQDPTTLINSIATILLGLACIIFFYLKFYIDIKPTWIGILFALILFLAFSAASFIIHHFFKNTGALIGIPIVFALAFLLHYLEKPLSSISYLFLKRKNEE